MKNKLLTTVLIVGLGTALIVFYELVLEHPIWILGGLVVMNLLIAAKNKMRRH